MNTASEYPRVKYTFSQILRMNFTINVLYFMHRLDGNYFCAQHNSLFTEITEQLISYFCYRLLMNKRKAEKGTSKTQRRKEGAGEERLARLAALVPFCWSFEEISFLGTVSGTSKDVSANLRSSMSILWTG